MICSKELFCQSSIEIMDPAIILKLVPGLQERSPTPTLETTILVDQPAIPMSHHRAVATLLHRTQVHMTAEHPVITNYSQRTASRQLARSQTRHLPMFIWHVHCPHCNSAQNAEQKHYPYPESRRHQMVIQPHPCIYSPPAPRHHVVR